jgi:hypothetical protein
MISFEIPHFKCYAAKHHLISETKLGTMTSSGNARIHELKEHLRQPDAERAAIQARIRGLEAASHAAR